MAVALDDALFVRAASSAMVIWRAYRMAVSTWYHFRTNKSRDR
jgi:hypothetical protein